MKREGHICPFKLPVGYRKKERRRRSTSQFDTIVFIFGPSPTNLPVQTQLTQNATLMHVLVWECSQDSLAHEQILVTDRASSQVLVDILLTDIEDYSQLCILIQHEKLGADINIVSQIIYTPPFTAQCSATHSRLLSFCLSKWLIQNIFYFFYFQNNQS